MQQSLFSIANPTRYQRFRRQLILYFPWLDEITSVFSQIGLDEAELAKYASNPPDQILEPLRYAQYLECNQRCWRHSFTVAAVAVALLGLTLFLTAFFVLTPAGWGLLTLATGIGLTLALPIAVNKLIKWGQQLNNKLSSRIRMASLTQLTENKIRAVTKKMAISDQCSDIEKLIAGFKSQQSAVEVKLSADQLSTLSKDFLLNENTPAQTWLQNLNMNSTKDMSLPIDLFKSLGWYKKIKLTRALNTLRKHLCAEQQLLTELQLQTLCTTLNLNPAQVTKLRYHLGFTYEQVQHFRAVHHLPMASLATLRNYSGDIDPYANQHIGIHARKISKRVILSLIGLVAGMVYVSAMVFSGVPIFGQLILTTAILPVKIIAVVLGALIGARIGEDIGRSLDSYRDVDYNFRMQGIKKVNSSGRWKAIRPLREVVISAVIGVFSLIEGAWPGAGTFLAFALAGWLQTRALQSNRHFKDTDTLSLVIQPEMFTPFRLKTTWKLADLTHATVFWLDYRQKYLAKLAHLRLSDAITHRVYFNIRYPIEKAHTALGLEKSFWRHIITIILYPLAVVFGLTKSLVEGLLLLPSVFGIGENSYAQKRSKYLAKAELAEQNLQAIARYQTMTKDLSTTDDLVSADMQHLQITIAIYIQKKNDKKVELAQRLAEKLSNTEAMQAPHDSSNQPACSADQLAAQTDSSIKVAPVPEPTGMQYEYFIKPTFSKQPRDKAALDKPTYALNNLLHCS